MKNQAPVTKSFYKISSYLKNESPEKTERLLKAIFKQKLHSRRMVGYGQLPPELAQMNMSEYYERLGVIHRIITERFHKCIHRLQPGSVTTTSVEEMLILMLQTMNRDLVIWSNCLIQNHSVDLLLLDYQIAIEVNGGIHNAEFKMSQDSFKSDRLYDSFKIHSMAVENSDITRVASQITAQIKNHTLKKGDRKRIKKLCRDILIKTIAYWIDAKDIPILLLMNLNAPLALKSFHSKILQPLERSTSEERPMLEAA